MADEIQIQFVMPGQPAQILAEWKAEPPAPIREGGYAIVDESFNGLVFEARYYEPLGKFMRVLSFGLFSDFWENIWRLSVRFDEEGHTRTSVLIMGKAHEQTRAALGELAAEHGGSVGLRVGV